MANGIIKGINDIIGDINSVQNKLNANGGQTQSDFTANSNGLPFNNIASLKQGQLKRNIITWFVPQFGIIKMYVNPTAITYSKKKLISSDRTKGGYTLQYWGEALETINISGTTGSSGIEGIEILEQIYRAEQYAFDSAAIQIANNNAAVNISQSIGSSAGLSIGGSAGGSIGAVIGGVLGSGSSNNLSVSNPPSLAQLAFTIEMYYGGWIYRGYFDSMTIRETTDFLITYEMQFNATSRRGYRQNTFAFNRSAKNGPSEYNTPYSFSGNVSTGF